MPEQPTRGSIWRIPVPDNGSTRSKVVLALSLAAAVAAGAILLTACAASSITAPQASPTALGKTPQGSPENSTLAKAAASATPVAVASVATPQPRPSGSASPAPQAAKPAEPATPPATKSPVPQASSSIPAPASRVQKNEGGSVTIEAKWVADQIAGSSLPFAVALDTHSVDLDKIDLSRLATLRNDNGQQVAPAAWEAPPGGHHRSGTLTFPATVGGKPLLGTSTKYVELVIRDVAGVKERVIRWDLEVKS